MQSRHFPVLVEMDEDGYYIVSCPRFKGCRSYGATIEEAMVNIREAIELCLEDSLSEEENTFIGFRELEVHHA
ncbi:MAG TPA: type II toxin-antitoxin system HicB family antitoxin [bacterium]|nr:type II toxin-antitoxin system HicB family antitoxin [bacterium]